MGKTTSNKAKTGLTAEQEAIQDIGLSVSEDAEERKDEVNNIRRTWARIDNEVKNMGKTGLTIKQKAILADGLVNYFVRRTGKDPNETARALLHDFYIFSDDAEKLFKNSSQSIETYRNTAEIYLVAIQNEY